MSTGARVENPFAGQGSVLLDIGGDVGALVVTAPPSMEGVEVEIEPVGEHRHHHRAHVAVVRRPVQGDSVPSLVFPDLVAGRYDLFLKGTDQARLTVEVRGGEVATAAWPD